MLGDPEEWVEIVGDGRIMLSIGAGKTVCNGGGPLGTTRVISHDINLAGTEDQSARTIVPYSPSGPYPPGRSQS